MNQVCVTVKLMCDAELVDINVTPRVFVLARHMPDHEDIVCQRGGRSWGEDEVGRG
jgi:hypothetical protein